MSRIAIIAASLLAASSAAALAHSNDDRTEAQRDVIEQGRSEGTITWREGLKLRKEQAAIARRRAELLADGHLSRKERRELHGLQDKAEANIEHERDDTYHRLWWLPRVGK